MKGLMNVEELKEECLACKNRDMWSLPTQTTKKIFFKFRLFGPLSCPIAVQINETLGTPKKIVCSPFR